MIKRVLNQRRWAGILVFLLAGTPSSGFACDSSEAKRQPEATSESPPGKRAIQNEEPEDKEKQDKERGSPKRLRVYWDEGPRLTGLWGELVMRFGTEIQNDRYYTSFGRVMNNVIWSKREGAEAVWIFQIRLQVQI